MISVRFFVTKSSSFSELLPVIHLSQVGTDLLGTASTQKNTMVCLKRDAHLMLCEMLV